MGETLADVGEERLIAYLTDRFRADLPVGIGDDAAVWEHHGPLVAAADAMVEGVHFDLSYGTLADAGQKLVTVNVSDLAAMGAQPTHALLTAGLAGTVSLAAACGLIDGVAEAAGSYGLVVAGGDVTGSPGPAMLSLTLLGRPAGEVLKRRGARPGDGIWVTGTLGLAGAGFLRLSGRLGGPLDEAVRRCLRPTARLDDGLALARWGRCSAAIDLSDGLGTDAPRLARASQVDLVLDVDRLPLHGEVAGLGEQGISLAVWGGEDFELLFTASETPPVAATRIGEVLEGSGEVRWRQSGRLVTPPGGAGFSHF